MTERIRLAALGALAVLAALAVTGAIYLLSVGAPAEVALAVLGLGQACAGAIGGALTLGKDS